LITYVQTNSSLVCTYQCERCKLSLSFLGKKNCRRTRRNFEKSTATGKRSYGNTCMTFSVNIKSKLILDFLCFSDLFSTIKLIQLNISYVSVYKLSLSTCLLNLLCHSLHKYRYSVNR
jgi:hypothetical protein